MIKNFLLYSLPKHLIYLIPIFLITGPFLSDLAVTLVSIIFVILVVKNKQFYIFKNNFFVIFIVFYFYLIANSSFQNQNLDSLRISFSYIRFGLFSLALMYFLNHDPKLIKKIFYSILLIFIILIFDGFFQYIIGQNLLGWKLKYPGPRVASLFGDELILGSYVSRMFPLLIGLVFFINFTNKKNFLLFIVIICSIFLVLISGERTAFFLIILSLCLMFFLINENKKIMRYFFIISMSMLILTISTSERIKQRLIDVTLEKMFVSDENTRNYIFSRQHDEHYVSAIRMFKQNPLTGVGVKNFRVFCSEKEFYISEFTCSSHPHNTYIQLLSETGIIGFIIIFSCFIFLTYNMIIHYLGGLKKKPKFNDLQVCLIIAIYLTLWPLVPSGNFFNNWLSIIYYYPVGIFLWSLQSNQNKY